MATLNMPSWNNSRMNSGSKYRKIRPTEPLWIIFDGGNTDIKAMIHAHWGEEIVFPHAVRTVNAVDYEGVANSYKHKRAEFDGTAIFESNDKSYVVGLHATQVGQGDRVVGAAKYTRDHYGAMFEAAMIQLYPDDHPDVRVVALHPPQLETENLKRLYKSLIGTHVVNLPDGRKFIYNVTEIINVEEPVADLQSFLMSTDGKAYANPKLKLQPGMEVLVLDVGGGLSVFVPCLIRKNGGVEVNIQGAPIIDKGIQDVVDVFEKELKSAFPDDLGTLKKVPQQMMYNALMSSEIIIKNKPYDCSRQVSNSMQIIAYPIQTNYSNRYSNGANFNGIVIGGGGGGVSYNYLSTHVLGHDFIFTAEEELDRMRFAGVRGGSKGLIPYLSGK